MRKDAEEVGLVKAAGAGHPVLLHDADLEALHGIRQMRRDDQVAVLQYTYYSVISPEGCASILWRTSDMAKQAAVAMRLTAREQQALGVIDTVIGEPGEGAHDDPDETARRSSGLALERTFGRTPQPN